MIFEILYSSLFSVIFSVVAVAGIAHAMKYIAGLKGQIEMIDYDNIEELPDLREVDSGIIPHQKTSIKKMYA